MAGCKLYITEGVTTTPATAFKDYALTVGQEHPYPIVADAAGVIPAFWLADGIYRCRLTDASGVTSNGGFDIQTVQALGPSSGTGGAGDTIDPEAIFKTGMPLWMPTTGLKTGWVRLNARTIGSATSGATERANADCEALFLHIWNNFADALCAVSGGRGISAAADWAANKTITTLDMRRRGAFGVVDMGNTAATDFDALTFLSGNKTTGGSALGGSTVTLATTNLPPYTPAGSVGITDPGHIHDSNIVVNASALGGSGAAAASTGGGANTADPNTSSNSSGITASFTGTAQGGASTPVDKMSPGLLGTWFIKL